MSHLVLYAIPAFILAMIVEGLWAVRHPQARGYEKRDTATSLTMGLANVAINAGTTLAITLPLYTLAYDHRLAHLGRPNAWWSWLVLLFAEDCCYYWFHRIHHEVRVLWAAHVIHHSSQHYNLSTALRQPILTPVTGPIFWVPLGLLGFSPAMVLLAQAWSLLYQFGLHTEAIGRLGPLEWLLNTPSHHRVHHGKNVAYLDRNHAGIFIVWDRLFGTFAPEREPVVFGLTKDIHTFHPVRVGTHELVAIAADVRRAPGLGAKLGYIFAPPGWSHDGSTHTATQLRQAANGPPTA